MVRTFLAAGNMVTAFLLAIITIVFLGLNYPPAISASLKTSPVAAPGRIHGQANAASAAARRSGSTSGSSARTRRYRSSPTR